jgi:hypothetical protein
MELGRGAEIIFVEASGEGGSEGDKGRAISVDEVAVVDVDG